MFKRFLVSVFLVLFVCGCHGLTVQQHELSPFPQIPDDARLSPVTFSKVRYGVPTGSPLAATSPKGVFGFFLCGSPYDRMSVATVQRHFDDAKMKDLFVSTMVSQGYDVTGRPDRMFDSEEDEYRTVYSVGAYVSVLRMDLCNRRTFWMNYERGYSGEAEIGVEWSVYDKLRHHVVYKTSTRGYSNLPIPNYEGIELLIEDAFAAAAHNLGADEKFRDLVVLGVSPENSPKEIQDVNEDHDGLFDPLERVSVDNIPLSRIPAAGRLEDLRDAAVLVRTGGGYGSGFFVSDQGHILTNAHVTGNAPRVLIRTSGRKNNLMAEVLRLDRGRDVALLKLEEIPEDLNFKVLPVRMERPKVGEDIYTVGAPFKEALQDTVTKGIVSAVRYKGYKRSWVIQGDITAQAGSSGGPLLDVNGNLIGMAAPSATEEDNAVSEASFLNDFIPVSDVFEALKITVRE